MHPAPRTPSRPPTTLLLALATSLVLLASAHAQDLTTALYPDDATRRGACNLAMTTGAQAADRYMATIDDQRNQIRYARVIFVNAPLRNLAVGCADNVRFDRGYTVDDMVANDFYASDHVRVLIYHDRLPEAFFMVNSHARLVAVDAAGREVAHIEPDPMASDLIGAETRSTVDPTTGVRLWDGFSSFVLPLHDEAFRNAIVDGATLRIVWRSPGPLFSERGVWNWPEGFGR